MQALNNIHASSVISINSTTHDITDIDDDDEWHLKVSAVMKIKKRECGTIIKLIKMITEAIFVPALLDFENLSEIPSHMMKY